MKMDNKTHYVTYRNLGRPERTASMSEENARRAADFLKWQGATAVKIKMVSEGDA